MAPVLLVTLPTCGWDSITFVASFDDAPWARALTTFRVTLNPIILVTTSHCNRWRFGAVVALQRFGRLLQFPLVSSGRFTRSHPEKGASVCSLWPQAVVGSRFGLVVVWRDATSPGSGRPVAAIAVRRGEPPYKGCNKSLELKTLKPPKTSKNNSKTQFS